MGKPITILELAIHRGAKADLGGGYTMGAIEDTGLPFMGGCSVCGACIAAYNACPSKSGFIKCASGCIDEDGWDTVEEANRDMEAFFQESDEEPNSSRDEDLYNEDDPYMG